MTSSMSPSVSLCAPYELFRIGYPTNGESGEKQLQIKTEKNEHFHESSVCQLPAFLKVCLTVSPAQVSPEQVSFWSLVTHSVGCPTTTLGMGVLGAQLNSRTLKAIQAALPWGPLAKNPFSTGLSLGPLVQLPCPLPWMFPRALESGLVDLMASAFSSPLGLLTSVSLLPHRIPASVCLQQIPCLLLCFTIFLVFGKLNESASPSSLCVLVRGRSLAKQGLRYAPIVLKEVRDFRSACKGLLIVRGQEGCSVNGFSCSSEMFPQNIPFSLSLAEVLSRQAFSLLKPDFCSLLLLPVKLIFCQSVCLSVSVPECSPH